ncbi:MAG TPA: DUF3488 and transglutaminase-like domain-containing protein, partial [Pyrinomonadaceae bacterium]|nr:DUF3488 and transglutaminase-like domain-containing protein [Pyrinomonadaceae bacterium]
MVCSVILLEMRRTLKQLQKDSGGRIGSNDDDNAKPFRMRKIPAAAIVLITLIIVFAVPMFFMLPRVGGAGIGGNSPGVHTISGFSDSVHLGEIGRIQQSDEVVMRVRIEKNGVTPTDLHWRGVALDTFDNTSWSKSNSGKETRVKGDQELIQVDYATRADKLAWQTVYLEPLDSPVLFALPRAVGVQGNFPLVYRDRFRSLFFPTASERISYRVISDVSEPEPRELRSDRMPLSTEDLNYLELPPDLDPRIAKLAGSITANTSNRYDAAFAMESYLRNNFGYTLEQKAAGDQPLADFLFNVKEGHCEYFSTAMAVMLRTQGIATRVVNGFQRGDYNETADVYVVRQKNAHSWVEVYFPGEKAWVTFDPTPIAGRDLTGSTSGIVNRFNSYMDALETFWIQYFVAFDDQEQRSLFTSAKRSFIDLQRNSAVYFDRTQVAIAKWWKDVRGDNGLGTSFAAVGWGVAYTAAALCGLVLLVWLYRKVVKLKVWAWLRNRFLSKRNASIVEFYGRMQAVLASKGFIRETHQTPLEFAFELGMPDAVRITEKYNSVRFGEKGLSRAESEEIENWLQAISVED